MAGKELQASEMMVLRRMEGATRLDRVRNVDVRRALGQVAVMDTVKEKQRRWKEYKVNGVIAMMTKFPPLVNNQHMGSKCLVSLSGRL